jgi:hypothetical protein
MKILKIWIAAFFLTLVSGLFIVTPLTFDAELRFGFPDHWLIANRSIFPEAPWRFTFLWIGFIVDLAIYVLLVTTATVIYEKKLKFVSNRNIYRISFLLFYAVLVSCCWAFIIWLSSLDFGLLMPWRSPTEYEIASGIKSWLRFLLGFMAVIMTWFLIKYFKRASTP